MHIDTYYIITNIYKTNIHNTMSTNTDIQEYHISGAKLTLVSPSYMYVYGFIQQY